MIKFKIFVNFEKEEQYLNEMSLNGFALVKYNSLGVYTFKNIEPKAMNYKVDYRVFKNKMQFEEYVTLFDDAGWEHVYGTKSSGSQYFLPKSNTEQNSDIFSDKESKAERHKRLYAQCVSSFTLMLVYLIITMPSASKNYSLFDFNTWYFTPGIWDKSGSDFWRAFIFETPFVVLRIAPFVVFLILTVVYGVWAFKADMLYRKSKTGK